MAGGGLDSGDVEAIMTIPRQCLSWEAFRRPPTQDQESVTSYPLESTSPLTQTLKSHVFWAHMLTSQRK